MCKFKEKFTDYADRFIVDDDTEDQMIIVKREHCFAVAELTLELMKSVSDSAEDLLAAEVAGLLHDVGRFKQYRQYRTFSDAKSENHAALSVKVVKELGLLEFLPKPERELILSAILWHNLPELPEIQESRQRILAQAVRDADKIDIYSVVLDYYERPELHETVALDLPDKPEVSPDVISALTARELVKMTSLRTVNDFKLCQLAWVYDLNLSRSKQIFVERNYMERMFKLIPEFPEFSNIRQQLNDHLTGENLNDPK